MPNNFVMNLNKYSFNYKYFFQLYISFNNDSEKILINLFYFLYCYNKLKSFTNNFDKDFFRSLTIKFAIENLLPWTKV